jgi:hypothetical protein
LELTAFIDNLEKNNYSDFLIDIGANIGLTSCQNGTKFKVVHVSEQIHFAAKILEVNPKMKLHEIKHFIYKLSLGEYD